jgi:chemotaxis protein MotC
MSRGTLRLSLAALLTLSGVGARASEFVDRLRDLNTIQNRIVLGKSDAREAAMRQFQRIEQLLPTISAEEWKQPASIRAVVTYLLCGGSARAIRKLVTEKAIEYDDPLIKGAITFAEGHGKEAAKILLPIDAKQYPTLLGAHLALIQGGLSIGADNARAAALLDLARLLMPGSLVEEAALRRELSVLDSAKETQKIVLLARRYQTTYIKSPFAKSFWNELGIATEKAAFRLDAEEFAKLEELYARAEPSVAFDVRLAIARKAVLEGRVALARAQIEKAASVADTPAAQNRLNAYKAVLTTMAGNFSEGLTALDKVEHASLPRQERRLRSIVTSAVGRLQGEERPPAAAPLSLPKPAPVVAEDEEPAVAGLARRALADTDAILERASKP